MGKYNVSISNKMLRHTVYLYLETALHVSGVIPPIIRSAYNCIYSIGICHTVTAICSYRGRVGTGLSVLWVACSGETSVASFICQQQ
jgi:hypothetical protein